jgi:hypothetical protein
MDPKVREQERRNAAVNECAQAESYGNLGRLARPLRRAPIQQRIHEAIYAADVANEKAAAAQRAKNILDRIPELGELLDALDQF